MSCPIPSVNDAYLMKLEIEFTKILTQLTLLNKQLYSKNLDEIGKTYSHLCGYFNSYNYVIKNDELKNALSCVNSFIVSGIAPFYVPSAEVMSDKTYSNAITNINYAFGAMKKAYAILNKLIKE